MASSPEKTYLELSEGSSHKFYEVTVEGATVTARYGRIGTNGQTRVDEFASPQDAADAAQKKIREKLNKGYEPATPGEREKQAVGSGASPAAKRIGTRFYFEDLPEGAADYPTADGRVLRFDTVEGYEAKCTWGLTRLPAESDEFPTDGVECRVWVPDADGRVWTAASRFTAEYFYDELARAQLENVRAFSYFDRAPAELQALFDADLVLEGARFASDDRFYRSLWRVAEERVQVIFKYSVLLFDVAMKERESLPESPEFYVRLRCDGYEPDAIPDEIHHTYDLPPILFEMDDVPGRMLRSNSARYNPACMWWEEGLFSEAVVFEPTDERGAPNAHVYVKA